MLRAELLMAEMEPSSEVGSGWEVFPPPLPAVPMIPQFKDPIDSIVLPWHRRRTGGLSCEEP